MNNNGYKPIYVSIILSKPQKTHSLLSTIYHNLQYIKTYREFLEITSLKNHQIF